MKNKLNNELAVCGFSAVKTLEKHNSERIKRLYFTEERAPLFGGLCKNLAKRKIPYNQVKDASELERLCGSVHHQGVVAMIEMPQITHLDTNIVDGWILNKENALVLDHVGNANNFGAIVRSAAFFGMKNIVITENESERLITTSSYRVAEGGMEFVNIYSVRSLLALFAATNEQMAKIGTALDATNPISTIKSLCKGKPALIVLGNEETGISNEVKKACDDLVVIPFTGMKQGRASPVQSLNVAQSASVILYEIFSEKT